ncbi:hypothetical protein D3C77_284770 [compost metagenome]
MHEEQYADHRQRNGDHRDQYRTQGAEEQEDHDDDDQYRFDQSLHHLIDRRLDKQGGVVSDRGLEVGRQLASQVGQQFAHLLDHIQRVGAGRGLDTDVDRRGAIERTDGVVVFRAHLDPCHVAEQHPAVAAGLERDVGEGLGGFQFGGGVDAGDDVLALDLAGGRKEVVAAYRVGHLIGAQAVAGEFHRVDPQAHGKQLVAEDLRFGHAGQGGQFGLDHPRQVVSDLRIAQFTAVEADVHQRRSVGGFLAQHRVFGVLRQLVLDLVGLGQQFGEQPVAVGTDPRIDRDHGKILPAHRGHVVDAFGTRQALLHGLGDVALDGFGVGPGVGGGYRDQGVFHLRILTDRQFAPGLEAQQHDQQADHAGQHRTADERIGKGHDASSISWRATGGCSLGLAGSCPG